MIFRSRGANVEVRSASANAFREPKVLSWGTVSTRGDVAGLPAVLGAGRMICEAVGGLDPEVYRKLPDGRREEAKDSWQYELLDHAPNGLMTPFGFYTYIARCLLFHGNAYLLKSKTRGEVMELWPVDPSSVTPRRYGTEMRYELRDQQFGQAVLSRDEVVHLVGLTQNDPYVGVSVIQAAAPSLRKQLHAEVYQQRLWENDATPGGLLSTNERLTAQQRSELREAWSDRHRGAGNAGKLAVLDSGATYQPIGITPRDAQFVEAAKLSIRETALIFTMPSGMLGDVEVQASNSLEEEHRRFLRTALTAPIKWIEQSLRADRDLFPNPDQLTFEFDTDQYAMPDMRSRYDSYVAARQAGWLSINDIRSFEDLPPIDGGDTYQETPVGGAPNLQPGDANAA